jgi:lactate dehydrogenase-like 2-hydroxyacid dehydrogenase
MAGTRIVSFLHLPKEFLGSLLNDKIDELTIISAGTKPLVTEEMACEAVKGASIILAFPGTPDLSRKVLEAAEGVKLVQFWSVGYDNIDLEAADELGIPVANNPGWNAISVAEHTLMLILMTLKKALTATSRSLEKDFSIGERHQLFKDTRELYGKTLGLIGLGSIGLEVAKRARAFSPRIIYHKRNRLPIDEEEFLGVEYRSLGELLSESDILSLHVPLTDETRMMIGKEEIGLMKDGAIIINTARSGILDEYAAAEALREGRLSAVGLDVVKQEKRDGMMISESPLFECENVVYTPHQSGNSSEASARSHIRWVENVCRVLNGEKPSFVVNNVS